MFDHFEFKVKRVFDFKTIQVFFNSSPLPIKKYFHYTKFEKPDTHVLIPLFLIIKIIIINFTVGQYN